LNGLFITSTGTEIGKTFVTASLCHQLRLANKSVHAVKPIISGVSDDDMTGTDTAIIAESLGSPLNTQNLDTVSPFRYKAPLAPSMAAALEGKELDFQALITFCQNQLSQNDFTLIEGVGGSFVPLTDTHLVADWIKALGLSSILVAGSYLGTISHIIATFEAMQARDLPVKTIVISETNDEDAPNLHDTSAQVRTLLPVPVVTIPRLHGPAAWQNSPDLLQACLHL